MKDYFLRDGLKLKRFGQKKRASFAFQKFLMNIIINPMYSRFAKIDSEDKMRGIGNY